MAINLYVNPDNTTPPIVSQSVTSGNSITVSYYATPGIFPDGNRICIANVIGQCSVSGGWITTPIQGIDAVLKVTGYLCINGTSCIYTIRTDDAGVGKFECYASGTYYCICAPSLPSGCHTCYAYQVWYLDK